MIELIAKVIFGVNATMLLVLAAVYFVAGFRQQERYWTSWWLSSLILGVGLASFIVQDLLPRSIGVLLPNLMLILGFGLRWRAAREFSGRAVSNLVVIGPAAGFLLLCLLPPFVNAYGIVYTLVNIALTTLAVLTAWEFFRDHQDRLWSRYGLAFAYCLISLSFGLRVVQGLVEGSSMLNTVPRDLALLAHLIVSTVYITASGTFALSLAYERNAAELKKAASHDFLTGLLNRGAFEQKLRARCAAGVAKPFALALLDIDHFKAINDQHGHAAGDAVLRTCARIFRDHAREGDLVARVGGEEFALFFEGANTSDAERRLSRLIEAIAQCTMGYGGRAIRVTVSAGMLHCDGAADFDTVVAQADRLLYKAKSNGRNRAETLAA
ncbi:GGDEF domain-containing protein [Georhizobium profundi]|uniref:diguanylate cyclase n=1 Tax=Georhizobium profundi TaxID=2341112 RepID=A0A3Q8XR56_9HYPH|nr:GGDEF domain-containing protein [Georhizobium profundi]AZN73096.1 GGDEF domain-containing protein [Georhizobium profundi]